jgi:copper transport protein
MHIHTLPAMADLTIAPGHSGPVSAAIVLMTGDFGPLDPKAVTLVLSKPGTAPIEREAQKPGDGTWRVEDLVIPAPGKWNVEIRISAAKTIRLDGEIVIRP